MAEPLFEFNDGFISAMAGGLTDADSIELFSDGLQSMGDEVARSVALAYDRPMPVTVTEQGVTVWLDEEAAVEEFGADGAMPSQRISSGIERSRHAAEARFTEAVSADHR